MRGIIGLAGATTIVAALTTTIQQPRAEPHEPLARFFDIQRPAAPAPARAERRPSRPSPAPASPTLTAVRRPTAPPDQRPDFVVGVFGDAYAVSVARGLNDTEPGEPGRKVVDLSGDDASVASVDAPAWDAVIDAARRQGGRLDAAILMLGRADGVALTDSHGQRQEPGSPGWKRLYSDRVTAVADRFRDKHVPLIWVGLPIVRDAEAAQLSATLNEIVHERAVPEGATFVDTWQAFADENGDFSTTGPDVDGRPATLRWSNGWNFTRAGARKLASFLLPDLKRVRDRMTSTQELAAVPSANPDSFDQALSIDVNAQILREAGLQAAPPAPAAGADAAVQPKAGPVLMLTAAPLSEGGRLASIEPGTRSPSSEASGSAHAGRADDFAWPKP